MTEKHQSAAVVTFQPKGSYLRACREQGVFQRQEEERAELERLGASSRGDLKTKVLHLSTEPTLRAQREHILSRFRSICEAYQAAGLGDQHFPFLLHVLFSDVEACDAGREFFRAAIGHQHQRSPS